MFQTIAISVVSAVCALLCGVGYALYKKVIQMLKDIDEKYEGKLKNVVNELEVKHQESIQLLEIKVTVLEGIVNHNLEHMETLMIDLNNKNMVTRNMLYDVKKQFSVTSREYTSHYTNTMKEIDIIKTIFNDMKKVIVTQEELEEAVFEGGPFQGNTETQIGMYNARQVNAWIKCLNSECKSNCTQIGHKCHGHKNGYFTGGFMTQRVIRINKKYYLYSNSIVREDKGKILPGCAEGIIFNMSPKYDETTGYYAVYECGRMNVITKEVSWH